jgi:hypothetical protein
MPVQTKEVISNVGILKQVVILRWAYRSHWEKRSAYSTLLRKCRLED